MNKSNTAADILIFIVGVILIALHAQENFMSFIVIMIGIIFALPAFFGMCAWIINNKDDQNILLLTSMISSIGGLGFGLFLIFKPELFVGFLAYIFSVILIVSGLYHIIYMVTIKYVKINIGFYLIPVLTTFAGFIILFTDIRNIDSIVVLITGISFLCSAVNSFFSFPRIQKKAE